MNTRIAQTNNEYNAEAILSVIELTLFLVIVFMTIVEFGQFKKSVT